MTPKEFKEFLKADLLKDEPPLVFVWGQPGIGKTWIVHDVCAELDFHLVVLEVSTIHPYALSGIPVPKVRERLVELLPLRFVDEIIKASNKRCVLFLDDFGAADPYQQRIALCLTTYKQIGDVKLPPDTRIIVATNREEDAAYVVTPSYAILNRVKHYNLVPKFEDWVEWIKTRYSHHEPLVSMVIRFLSLRSEYFCWTPDEAMKKRMAAYPTPRSWTHFIKDCYDKYNNLELLAKQCACWVGKEAASEFYKFFLVPEDEIETILNAPIMIRRKAKVEQILIISKIISRAKSEKTLINSLEKILKLVDNDVLASVLHLLKEDEALENLRARLSLIVIERERNRTRQGE